MKLASFKDHILCYTDGSKQDSYTGYAFSIDKKSFECKILEYSSITPLYFKY